MRKTNQKQVKRKGIKVLSLFDGMSCGMLALEKAGIKVDEYYASEIDKYAQIVSHANYPQIKRLGDVRGVSLMSLPWVDLLIAGSPCQGFSFAGKQLNFDDPRSALFFEFVRLIEEMQPKYFLLENVKMKKEYQDVISKYLGVEPIQINSALVCAQNRRRLYWTNIPGIKQPKDKGLLLKDIFTGGEEITERVLRKPLGTSTYKNTWKNMRNLNSKANCLTASGQNISNASCTNIATSRKICNVNPSGNEMNGWVYDTNFKSPTLTTNKGEGIKISFDKISYRKLTPIECERLQTVPDDYTNHVSNTQRYKMLGNGWTVDVISHIFKNMKL